MQALHSPTFRAVAMISVSTGPASETARVSTFRASLPVRLQASARRVVAPPRTPPWPATDGSSFLPGGVLFSAPVPEIVGEDGLPHGQCHRRRAAGFPQRQTPFYSSPPY